MELRLQKFIQSMGVLSDIRNLDPLNPTIFQIEHPVTATRYITISAINEPSHLGIPINTTWTVLDPQSVYYQKALKLKARAGIIVPGITPLPGLTQVWIEISTYDEIFSDPQYYDNGEGGAQGPQGPAGPMGPQGPAGPRGLDAVVDYEYIINEVLDRMEPSVPSLSITGANSVNESTTSQYTVNLVVGGVATPIINPITISTVGAPASISAGGLLTVQALTASANITLTSSYQYNGETLTATKEVTLASAQLAGLVITGVPATLFEGQTAQASAIASFVSGQANTNVSSLSTWSVNPVSAGTISASGLFTASSVAADTPFTITANYTEGANTQNATADSATIKIVPTSLAIAGVDTIFESLTSQYNVTVTRNNGTTANVNATAIWGTSNNAVGAFNATGLLTTALVTGDTPLTLTASYTAAGVTVSDTLDITVINLVPTGLTISGASQVYEGGTVQFSAECANNNGVSQAVVPVWSVTPPGAGSINASGLFTAAQVVSDTMATIHAEFTASGVTVTADHPLEVTNIVPVSLTLEATATEVTEGGTSQVTATVTRNDGTTATVTPTYTRSPTSGGTIAANGLFTSAQVVQDTLVTVTGSYTNSGVTVTGTVDINVMDVPVSLTPYFGAAPTNSTINSALVLGLSERGPNNNRLNPSMVIIDGPGISMFYAYPVSYGQATFTDLSNGFQGGWDGASGDNGITLGPVTINVSVNGTPTPFYVYKTDQENISPAGNPTTWAVS